MRLFSQCIPVGFGCTHIWVQKRTCLQNWQFGSPHGKRKLIFKTELKEIKVLFLVEKELLHPGQCGLVVGCHPLH